MIANENTNSKFWALGGSRTPTVMSTVDSDYVKNFYLLLRDKNSFDRFMIQNANLGEGGTSQAGGATG